MPFACRLSPLHPGYVIIVCAEVKGNVANKAVNAMMENMTFTQCEALQNEASIDFESSLYCAEYCDDAGMRRRVSWVVE